MRWTKYEHKDRYARYLIVSDVGYSVMRCVVGTTPIDRYVAFKGLSGSPGFKVLGGEPSEKAAKALCEAHYAQSREVAVA